MGDKSANFQAHRRFVSVPINAEAMYNDYYGHWKPEELYIWYLTDEDNSLLWECGVFDFLNKKFDIIIDDYEDEGIYYQKLFLHKAELFEQLNGFRCKERIERLKEMIDKAIEAKTLLSFVL